MKKLLLTSHPPSDSTPTPANSKGVKVPKTDLPKFDGNIVNWEQFCISIHGRSNLSNSEKLVYLEHSLNDGSTMNVIKGFSLRKVLCRAHREPQGTPTIAFASFIELTCA